VGFVEILMMKQDPEKMNLAENMVKVELFHEPMLREDKLIWKFN
jgi:hypothetical protein